MKLKRSSIFTRIVLLALLAYGLALLVSAWRSTAAAEAENAALRQEIETVRRENLELSYQIQHADDPELLEEIAREKLQLVKPGERILYDTGG